MKPSWTEVVICLPVGLAGMFLAPFLILELAAVVGLPLGLSYWTAFGAWITMNWLTGWIEAPSSKTEHKAGDLYKMAFTRLGLFTAASIMIFWVL